MESDVATTPQTLPLVLVIDIVGYLSTRLPGCFDMKIADHLEVETWILAGLE
jgi:hypothetical protein